MDFFSDFIKSVVGALLSFLPDSPFTSIIESVEQLEFLPFLNWFVPVGTLIGIGTAWLTCIGIYYVYQVVLRWAKVIGD